MHPVSSKLAALRPRLPRVAVALAGDDMLEQAQQLVGEFGFFEFRLDSIGDPYEAVFDTGRFLRRHPGIMAICTCRRVANGGAFSGTPADEIDLLRQAAAVGAHIVDLSLETAEDTATNPAALDPLRRSNATLLLSWHDFRGTPAGLESIHARMAAFQPDAFKIVPTATCVRDGFALLDLLQAHAGQQNLAAMSMGAPGIFTRVLGPRYGSLFTFAAAPGSCGTAPGQIDARTLRDGYRMQDITSATKIYGVFGNPIGGSRSPVMLNAAFAETATDAVYLPLETGDADEVFAAFGRLPLAGASVTMPLKERVLPLLRRVDSAASRIAAVNTIRREADGSLAGRNTDAEAIVLPLRAALAPRDLRDCRILILGAGGAARAAVFGLAEAGAQLFILGRTPEKAALLAAEAGGTAVTLTDLAGQRFDAIVNATPYGMANQQSEPPMPPDRLSCDVFFDLVYNPIETPLVQAARRHGCRIVHGIEMFVLQGAAQFTWWTGTHAPVETMRRAVEASLQG